MVQQVARVENGNTQPNYTLQPLILKYTLAQNLPWLFTFLAAMTSTDCQMVHQYPAHPTAIVIIKLCVPILVLRYLQSPNTN
jgi:hypothetical protein